MEKENKKILYIIVSLALVIISGTFAWLSWGTQKTSLVLTVGDIRGLTVTLKPYQINSSLSPVSTYTDGIAIDITAANAKTEDDKFKLFYKIDTIDTALIDSSFKYTITKCTANCDTPSNYTIPSGSGGNFASASSNSNLNIYQETVPANTTYKYKVYLWIDNSGGNQSNMQNKTFQGELRASISETVYSMMKNNAVIDNTKSKYVTATTGINWNTISSDTNGKGIYLRAGTENDQYPIYYYRGNVTDNNVLFAGFCWKIVRTTSTGGTKLIYNGTLQANFNLTPLPDSSFTVTNDATYPFTYDSTNMTWTSTMHDHSQSAEITFVPTSSGNYVVEYTVSSEANWDKAIIYKNGTELKNVSGEVTGKIILDGLTTSDTIKVKYQKDSSTSRNNDNVVFTINSKGASSGTTCENSGIDSQLASTSAFNSNLKSPASDVGYMYGTGYPYSAATGTGWYYAPDVTYSNGTYTLVSKGSYNVETKSDISGTNLNYQHYTCGSTTETACASVRYVYYVSSSTAYYITLTNGKKVEDALDEMLTSSSNTTDSKIKTTIDTWYANNMTSYTSKLEDTPYCNDRTIYQLNGWSPTGSTTSYLYLAPYGRAYSTYAPSLTCNTNDAFTVSASNGNGKLTYPVGLLTSDEIMLAGGKTGSSNSTYYLYTNQSWWSGSPGYFLDDRVTEFSVDSSGSLVKYYVLNAYGVRPTVSLKPGTKFSGGTGIGTNPYVVE